MRNWANRGGRAAMMGIAWAIAWVPVGVLIGWLIVGETEPEWIGGPLYAGFMCATIFSAVTGFAMGSRRLDTMSVPWSALRGAMSGLIGGTLFMLLVIASDPPKWWLIGGVAAVLTVASAITGAGLPSLMRMVNRNQVRPCDWIPDPAT
jgi:hypothetical protein